MSLIQYLSVTRCLGMVRDAPSRFKMTQENLLPKFGPAKLGEAEHYSLSALPAVAEVQVPVCRTQPAVQKTRAPALKIRTQPANAPIAAPPPAPESSTKMKPDLLEQSQKPAETSADSLPPICSPMRKSASAPLMKSWALLGAALLRPLKTLRNVFRFSSPLQSKPSRSGRNRGAVQPELGLDMVKPVRNDLNDTDLELIPARKPLAESELSATLVPEERARPGSRARLKPSAQRNVFSPPQGGPVEPSAPPEWDCAPGLKAVPQSALAFGPDFVGAWWGRVRTGLLRFRSRQT